VRSGAAVLGLLALCAAAPPPARAGTPERAAAGAEDAVPTGPGVEERLAQIRERIQAAVAYPPLARLRRLEGVAQVRFSIAVDGSPRDLSVAGSTGHAILDRAALAAVRAASPLPWVYGLLEVPVRFELSSRR
jgi:protein TonB